MACTFHALGKTESLLNFHPFFNIFFIHKTLAIEFSFPNHRYESIRALAKSHTVRSRSYAQDVLQRAQARPRILTIRKRRRGFRSDQIKWSRLVRRSAPSNLFPPHPTPIGRYQGIFHCHPWTNTNSPTTAGVQ